LGEDTTVATGSLVYGSKWNQTGRAKFLIRRTAITTRILEHTFHTKQKEGHAIGSLFPAKYQRRTEVTRMPKIYKNDEIIIFLQNRTNRKQGVTANQ
jgi:hypothetical protein